MVCSHVTTRRHNPKDHDLKTYLKKTEAIDILQALVTKWSLWTHSIFLKTNCWNWILSLVREHGSHNNYFSLKKDYRSSVAYKHTYIHIHIHIYTRMRAQPNSSSPLPQNRFPWDLSYRSVIPSKSSFSPKKSLSERGFPTKYLYARFVSPLLY
jgi:hypothetical protein